MKKVILIGGSGFLGSHLLQILQEEKIETLVVLNNTPIEYNEGINIIEGGISTITTNLINNFKPDVIFHCGRPTMPRFRKIGRILAANKSSRLNAKLVASIQKAKQGPKLVFASGSLMYGNSLSAHDESSALNPISYAKQYAKGEIPINEAVRKNNFPVIVLRFPWLLGNGSWFKWFYLDNIKKHHAIPEIGKMENSMEIIDVKDAAKLMWLYGESISSSGFFNIPSKRPVTQAGFIKEVASIFGVVGKNYKFLYSGDPEKEAIEAFTSNIILNSQFSGILDAYPFTSMTETLKRIKKNVQ